VAQLNKLSQHSPEDNDYNRNRIVGNPAETGNLPPGYKSRPLLVLEAARYLDTVANGNASAPVGNRTTVVQPVANHATDSSLRAQSGISLQVLLFESICVPILN
jgi:hypothetical protein